MKKYWSRQKYQAFQRRRAADRLDRRLNHKKKSRRHKHRSAADEPSWWFRERQTFPTIFPAPADFSLIREPVAAIDHLNRVEGAADRGKISVSDMTNVQEFSTDAVIAMIAYANDPKTYRNGGVRINEPFDFRLRDKFRDSGIFGRSSITLADGSLRQAHGAIFRTRETEVKGEIAKNLIEFSTEKIFGSVQHLKGVYATMVECMNNTFNHATARTAGKEQWWATVYCDTERRVAFFNFLDNGIGILESIKVRFSTSLLRLAGLKSDTTLLREILEGKIGSRTGLSYRGNGLPEIYKRFRRGQISRLIIIANNVYADLENDVYLILPKSFRGTFFHWEISYDKHFASIKNGDPGGLGIQQGSGRPGSG